jgi:hypothetical protein
MNEGYRGVAGSGNQDRAIIKNWYLGNGPATDNES